MAADTVPDRSPGFTPVINAVDGVDKLLSIIQSANSADWTSPAFIEGLITKAFAAVAFVHPGLSVGSWQPAITGVALAAVVIESGVRGYLKHKSLSAALSAAQATLHASSQVAGGSGAA